MELAQFAREFFRTFPGEFSDDVLRGKAFRRHQIQRAIQMEIAANSRVRVDGERLYPFRMPVVAPRESVVHSLLHDRPGAAQGEKEVVMVKLKAVLESVVVNLCSEPT